MKYLFKTKLKTIVVRQKWVGKKSKVVWRKKTTSSTNIPLFSYRNSEHLLSYWKSEQLIYAFANYRHNTLLNFTRHIVHHKPQTFKNEKTLEPKSRGSTTVPKYNSAGKKISSTVPKTKTCFNSAKNMNKVQHIKCGNQKINGERLQS